MDRALTQKPYKGWAMEGLTAKWYASLTRKSMDDFRALAIRVASGLPAHARVLEVAPGPIFRDRTCKAWRVLDYRA